MYALIFDSNKKKMFSTAQKLLNELDFIFKFFVYVVCVLFSLLFCVFGFCLLSFFVFYFVIDTQRTKHLRPQRVGMMM